MNTKTEVRQQLLGNMIIGRCEQESGILFQANLCSGSKCIRFSTPEIEKLLPSIKKKTGAWQTGHLLQYEIYNDGITLLFQLSMSVTGLTRSLQSKMQGFINAARTKSLPPEKEILPVRQWKYTVGADVQKAWLILNEIFDCELPFFESEIRLWQADHNHMLRSFPDLNSEDELTEGAEINIHANRFERNREARRKCIAHYGAACQICGFDFGLVYGADFTGKIEVHHIIPLSEIREDYIIDPINDLIPVCSNCHTALHSKQNGVYSPEEIKQLLKK